MKKIALVLALLVFLSGCSDTQEELNSVIRLCAQMQEKGCQFTAVITADYEEYLYCFTLACQADSNGAVVFEVLSPESIAGIRGEIAANAGKLTFDDVALAFPLLANDQITPIAAPWVFVKTLLGGYLQSAVREKDMLHLTANDSFLEDALLLDIWLDENMIPIRADILYRERKILSIAVEEFEIL